MFCIKCGYEIKAKDKRCPKCATPNVVPDLSDFMTFTKYLVEVLKLKEICCPTCGKTTMKITDQYCPTCYALNPFTMFSDYLLGPSPARAALPEAPGMGRSTRGTRPTETGEKTNGMRGPARSGSMEPESRRGRRVALTQAPGQQLPAGQYPQQPRRAPVSAPPYPQPPGPQPAGIGPPGAGGRYPGQQYPPTMPVPPRQAPGMPGGYGQQGQNTLGFVFSNLMNPSYLKVLLPRLATGMAVSFGLGFVLAMLMLGIGVDSGFEQLIITQSSNTGFLITSSLSFLYVSHGIGLVPSLTTQPAIPALEYLPMVFIPAVSLVVGGMLTAWLMRTKNVEESMVTGLLMALPYMLLMLIISFFIKLTIPTVSGLWYSVDIITLVVFTLLWAFMFGSLGGLIKGFAFR